MGHVVVLRVFVGPGGEGGNRLGVVLDGGEVPGAEARRRLAAELGFSETIFVDDAARGVVDIHTPSVRLPFAGHPLVGVAWLLRELGHPVDVLRPAAGEVRVSFEGELTWIRGRAEWVTARRTERLASPAEVDALPSPPPGEGWLYAWAYEDEDGGRVRARGFPRRGDGIVEDEATGAAALVLTAELGARSTSGRAWGRRSSPAGGRRAGSRWGGAWSGRRCTAFLDRLPHRVEKLLAALCHLALIPELSRR